MAYIGLAKPYVAKLINEVAKNYSDGFKCGKAMETSVTPNYNDAKLYADNQLAEQVIEFKEGTITLGTDRLPIAAKSVMFGHDASGNKVTYKSGDASNYVGVGFYVDKIEDGVRSYEATIIYKVKFAEGEESYTTKGDNIEFKTPSLSGTIAPLETGEWKTTKIFATETDAENWLKETLGINDSPAALGTLTVTSEAGTNSGDTKITVTEALSAGNSYRYKVTTNASNVTAGQDVSSWDSWDGSADITAASGKKITIVEADGNSRAVAAGSATVVSAA